MATVTRINGSKTDVGVLYNPNSNLYVITVKDKDNNAINLQVEDSYGGDAVTYGVIEAIVDEISPLAYFTPADTSGHIYVVMDKAISSAIELRTRIRNLGLVPGQPATTTGTRGTDISGSTVTAASSFTVA